jgi:hypothetical protein
LTPNNSASAQAAFDETSAETPTVEPTIEITPLVENIPQPEATPTFVATPTIEDAPTSVPTIEVSPTAVPSDLPAGTPMVTEAANQQISSALLKMTFMLSSNWTEQINAPMNVSGYKNVKAIILLSPEQTDQITLTPLTKKSTLSLDAWLKSQKARFPADIQIASLDKSVFGYPAIAAFGHISSGMSALYLFINRGKDVLEISYQSSSDFSFLTDFTYITSTLNPGDSAVLKENQIPDFSGLFPLVSFEESDLQALVAASCSGQTSAGSAQDATFFSGVLNKMGIPDTQFARDAFMAWKPYENTAACWNPLATTYQVAWFPSGTGCTEAVFNSAGVRGYSSKDCGQLATARTLLYSGSGTYYKPVRDMLSQTSFNWQAVHDSIKKWVGSESYATSITNKWQILWNSRSTAKCTVPSGQFCGEYYNNRTLSGTPAFAQNTGNINFNWGSGAPGNGVGSDNFSTRWQGIFTFESANYTFTVTADDGIRLYVDNALKSPTSPNQDPWRDQATTTYTYDIPLSAGNHTIKVEYYENGGGAIAQVSWQKKVYSSKWVSQSPYITVTQGSSAAMWVIYNNTGNTTWYNTYSPNRTHLGTLNPTTGEIDYASPFVCTPGWVGNNRPAILSNLSVAPGSNGTFSFQICVSPNQAPGIYRIAVAPLVESVSWMKSPQFVYWDITVKADPDDNRILTSDTALSGTINTPTDIDTYFFNATAGQVLTSLAMSKSGTSTIDSYIYLYGPNGSLLKTDDDSGGNQNSLISTYTLPQSGQYKVVTKSYNNASIGIYTIKITLSAVSGCNASCQSQLNKSVTLTNKQTVQARNLPGTTPVSILNTSYGIPGQVPLVAPVTSDSSNRFGDLYKAVIAQFGVNTNVRYIPVSKYICDGKPCTYCNTFAGDVARAMGNPLPTKKEYSGLNDRATIGFPALYNWFTSTGSSGLGWRKIDPYTTSGLQQIITHVNAGKMAVVVINGHIAVIRPGQGNVTSVYDLRIAQSGATNNVDIPVKTSFGSRTLLVYIHD